jgi:hypothetical protein
MAVLSARTWNQVVGPDASERDCGRAKVSVPLEIAQCALIVIDAWATHPNAGWQARMATNIPKLRTLVEAFRALRRPTFYDPTGLPMHPDILAGWGADDHMIAWEPLGGGTQVIGDLLKAAGIRTIFWAGYATNLCLMHKPCGFRKVMPLDWDRLQVLVRDATIASESAETLATEALHDATCYEVEYYPNGFTSTVLEVQRAFGLVDGGGEPLALRS